MLKVISQEKMLESNGGFTYKVPVYEYDDRGYLCRISDDGEGYFLYPDRYVVCYVNGRAIYQNNSFYGYHGLK